MSSRRRSSRRTKDSDEDEINDGFGDPDFGDTSSSDDDSAAEVRKSRKSLGKAKGANGRKGSSNDRGESDDGEKEDFIPKKKIPKKNEKVAASEEASKGTSSSLIATMAPPTSSVAPHKKFESNQRSTAFKRKRDQQTASGTTATSSPKPSSPSASKSPTPASSPMRPGETARNYIQIGDSRGKNTTTANQPSAATREAKTARTVLERVVMEDLRVLCDKQSIEPHYAAFASANKGIDLSGSFLRDHEETDFFDKDRSGAIVVKPPPPMFPEELGRRKKHPLSWWGVMEPAAGDGKYRTAERNGVAREDRERRNKTNEGPPPAHHRRHPDDPPIKDPPPLRPDARDWRRGEPPPPWHRGPPMRDGGPPMMYDNGPPMRDGGPPRMYDNGPPPPGNRRPPPPFEPNGPPHHDRRGPPNRYRDRR